MLRPGTPAPTPPPIRSLSPRRRWSRSHPIAPRGSTSCCGSTWPAPPTICSTGPGRGESASRLAMRSARALARRSRRFPSGPGARHWARRASRAQTGRSPDHPPARPPLLAAGLAGDRAPRARPPRRPAALHRLRRPPLPGDPHRPDRGRHRADRAPPPRQGAGGGPDPLRQRHRTGEAAVSRVCPQRRLARAVRARPRPARLDPGTGPERRARPLRAQAAALRLLHTAAGLAFSGRRAKLRLQAGWPWATELAAAFARLGALPAPAG